MLIETKNTRAIKALVRKTVETNQIAAVVGHIGSGKTTMFDWLTRYWKQHPDKFKVVTIKSFDSPYTKIGVIMRFMLELLDPGIHIPRGNERVYKLLEELLPKYADKNFKIILCIDEAQDLPRQTFFDIKKVHEIKGANGNCFSVIMFAKPHRRMLTIQETEEIGYRTNILLLDKLEEEEVLKIAQEKHNIGFSDAQTRRKFYQQLENKTPLEIQFVAQTLRKELNLQDGERIIIDKNMTIFALRRVLFMRLRQAGFTVNSIARYIENITGNKIARQRVSEYFNGHLDESHPTSQAIKAVCNQAIAEATKNWEQKVSGNTI